VFRKIARYCKDIGIKYVTFFAFSTENWNRPKKRLINYVAVSAVS
jgi:undecaprenyl diphosphate synthase